MSDLIRRQDAVSRISDLLMIECEGKRLPTWNEVYHAIECVPESGEYVIHCRTCKWWDTDENMFPLGYCNACKHGWYTEHWEINIRRTYKEDFFCADGEPLEVEEEEDEEEEE